MRKYYLGLFIILAIAFGCNDDRDNDGVENNKDLCPDTPRNEIVDSNGCSQAQADNDDDGDGIPNNKKCPDMRISYTNEIIFRFPDSVKKRLKELDNGHSDSIGEFFYDILSKYYNLSADPEIDEIMKSIYKVEFCDCGEFSPVLVSIDSHREYLNIETKLDNLKRDSDEGVEGDLNFNFTVLPGEIPNYDEKFTLITKKEEKNNFNHDLPKYLSTSKNVIAILDTGLDLEGQYSMNENGRGNKEILYRYDGPNSSNNCLVNYRSSGRNFVNNNDDFRDDHQGIGHGTLVTRTLTNELNLLGLSDYSILPLKVFDDKGKGNYWDIVCAMAYVNEIQRKTKKNKYKGDIKVINASFGISLESESLKIFKSYIDDLSESALFVASAGNCGEDTDNGTSHFPSGYNSKNIVAVGGYTVIKNTIRKDPFSNYGTNSIDVAAPFTLSKLNVYANDAYGNRNFGSTKVEGTSYSTPLVSARLLEIQMNNPQLRPKAIIDEFYNHQNLKDGQNLNDYFKTNKYYESLQN